MLLKEKKELEALLNKLQSSVQSADLQRIFLEFIKSHNELEILNRERLRIENQLLRSEGEMRNYSRNHQQEKAIQLRKEVENLREHLSNCDLQVMSYKRKAISLDEELHEVEKCERRRNTIYKENEKGYAQIRNDSDFKNKELKYSSVSSYEIKNKQDNKHSNYLALQPTYNNTTEDRPVLSYFEKLRNARSLVSTNKDKE